MKMSTKNAKNTVAVEAVEGRLRLRFRVNSSQRSLAVGLHDTKENRIRASLLARQIDVDLLSGSFDHTLEKYRPTVKAPVSVANLFEQFIQAREVASTTLDKYRAILNQLQAHTVGSKQAQTIGVATAKAFAETIRGDLSDRVYKERLGLLAACWNWSKQPINPWKTLQQRIRVPPKRKPNPFTKNEIIAIVNAFKCDRYYSHYAPFVEFLFLTGCRTGEARALRWGSIGKDAIWIGESISKGQRRSTKTNRDRYIPINDRLRSLLDGQQFRLSITADSMPDRLVFPSPTGLPIDEHNFANRAWRNVLAKLGIPYRRPYLTRSTFISHALESGMSPISIAALTGHAVRVLYESYVGTVTQPQIPNLF
jgi:integrase